MVIVVSPSELKTPADIDMKSKIWMSHILLWTQLYKLEIITFFLKYFTQSPYVPFKWLQTNCSNLRLWKMCINAEDFSLEYQSLWQLQMDLQTTVFLMSLWLYTSHLIRNFPSPSSHRQTRSTRNDRTKSANSTCTRMIRNCWICTKEMHYNWTTKTQDTWD